MSAKSGRCSSTAQFPVRPWICQPHRPDHSTDIPFLKARNNFHFYLLQMESFEIEVFTAVKTRIMIFRVVIPEDISDTFPETLVTTYRTGVTT